MIRVIIGILAAMPASAETVVAARTIPAHTIIAPEDLAVKAATVPGAATLPDELIGMETRIALYAGRPVSPADVGFPSVVDRNQIVPLIYERDGLKISTDGRSLDRAGPGDVIRVMNIASRKTVTARIGIDGAAYVGQ